MYSLACTHTPRAIAPRLAAAGACPGGWAAAQNLPIIVDVRPPVGRLGTGARTLREVVTRFVAHHLHTRTHSTSVDVVRRN